MEIWGNAVEREEEEGEEGEDGEGKFQINLFTPSCVNSGYVGSSVYKCLEDTLSFNIF